MSNEHTPGPWYPKIGEQLGMVISDTASVPVAAVYDKKDTNLVAAAADFFEAAAEIEADAEECLDFDECTAMLVPIDSYHKLIDALNKAKGL